MARVTSLRSDALSKSSSKSTFKLTNSSFGKEFSCVAFGSNKAALARWLMRLAKARTISQR